MFVADYPIAQATPAEYNPRHIDAASFSALRQSIRTLGIVKAVIVTDTGKIIAGHQRTRAIAAEGISTSPAHILHGVGSEDEIRFNQLHNASDKEITDAQIAVPRSTRPGWKLVASARVRVTQRPHFASKLNEVLRLLAKHGEWGNAVATCSGRVIAGQLYAYACTLLGIPLRLCVVEDRLEPQIVDKLARSYGQFSYGHLPKTTWVQSLAQMFRIRNGREARGRSTTYETLVIPRLTRRMRVLDFGAGQKDYVRYLRRRGYNILGVEFYLRKRGAMELDLPAIHRDIDAVCESLGRHGLFDLVVCDSVLNSVDSLQAERDVLTTINALCRPGGLLIFSGRSREFVDSIEDRLKYSRNVAKKGVYFTDRHGFSAMYQRGVWLFQKFHTEPQASRLARRFIGPDVTYQRTTSSWSVIGTRSIDLPRPEPSLAREFDLPLPDGTRLGRHNDLLSAYRKALQIARDSRAARDSSPAIRSPL